jgi:hypothetical protein
MIVYVQEEPLQGYCSPLVNHFISPPSVALIIDHHSMLLMPLSLMMAQQLTMTFWM